MADLPSFEHSVCRRLSVLTNRVIGLIDGENFWWRWQAIQPLIQSITPRPQEDSFSSNPSLLYHSLLTHNHKVASPPYIQLASITQLHRYSHILSDTHYSFLHRNSSPTHQISHTLIKTNASPYQGLCAFDGDFVAFFHLILGNLSVTRIIDAVRETGELDAICNEDAVRGEGAVGKCYN